MKAFLVEQPASRGASPACGAAAPCLEVVVADSFLARARGLLGRPEPPPGWGLLLVDVSAVHGFGMRHALDLVFLDSRGSIMQFHSLAPWRIARCRRARHVLELRAGEISRLGWRLQMRLRLMPAHDNDAGCTDGHARGARSPSVIVGIIAAALLASLPAHGSSARLPAVAAGESAGSPFHEGSPQGPGTGRSDVSPALDRLSLVRPVSMLTLQRLEEEAEALYRREDSSQTSLAELVRRYESLAELSAQRSPHAWLRIGNIHQRAGTVGAAIDAYRKVRSEGAAQIEATTAERKALLNLAAIALDQARQSLTRLAALPAAPEPSGLPVSPEGMLRGQVELLQQHLQRQAAHPDPSQVAQSTAEPSQAPYILERYTASGRRNAVKTARGSLHSNPANELPAPPVTRPRPLPSAPPLPSVEYLLGDPLRSAKQPDGEKAAGTKTSAPERAVRAR